MAAADTPLVNCGCVFGCDLAGSLLDAPWVSRLNRLVEIFALDATLNADTVFPMPCEDLKTEKT